MQPSFPTTPGLPADIVITVDVVAIIATVAVIAVVVVVAVVVIVAITALKLCFNEAESINFQFSASKSIFFVFFVGEVEER